MRRKLFVFASAMSLLVFLIMVILFFFGYADIYSAGNAATSRGEFAVYVSSGALGFTIVKDKKPVPTPSATTQSESYRSDLMHGEEQSWTRMGVSYFSGHFTVTHEVGRDRKTTLLPGSWGHVTSIEISLVLPLLLSLPLSLIAVAYFIFWAASKLRHAKGFCPKCGYDLTGNASGVCPECGTAVKAA